MMQRHMPIGYKMVDGKIQIEESKAAVVRKVFADYLSGVSTYALAKNLIAMGFLNANNKASWNHGSIGKILENSKYVGDGFYPQIIESHIFEQVQNRRGELREKLGRTAQPNSMAKEYTFSGKLLCGECGEIFKKYIEHAGKKSERSNWKCSKYIYNNRVFCRCGVITDEQLMQAFVIAANRIISRPGILERKPKEQPQANNLEFKRLDQQIKELEADNRHSSKELSQLIFQRAIVRYSTAQIKDYEYNTNKMKQAFLDKELQSEFDDNLFLAIIKHITVYKDGRLKFEFVDGLTLDGTYEAVERKQ